MINHVLRASCHTVDGCDVTRPNIYIRHRYSYSSSSLPNENMLRLALRHESAPFEDSAQFYERTLFAGRTCLYHDQRRRPRATLIATAVAHHNSKLLHAAAAAAAAASIAVHNAVVTAAAEASTDAPTAAD